MWFGLRLTFSSDREYYIHMNTEAMQNQYDHLMSSSKSFCYCELLLKISCLFEQTRWIHVLISFIELYFKLNNIRRGIRGFNGEVVDMHL